MAKIFILCLVPVPATLPILATALPESFDFIFRKQTSPLNERKGTSPQHTRGISYPHYQQQPRRRGGFLKIIPPPSNEKAKTLQTLAEQ